MNQPAKLLVTASWLVAGLAVLSVVTVWLELLDWKLAGLTGYELFPLLGLVAFVLMWSHYISAVLRLHLKLDKAVTKQYWTVTSWIVLIAILLHPTILIFNLWQDGFGLPPSSYLENYVSPKLKWAAALGTFSLLIFLTYELHRWFELKKWWPYIQSASDVAMLAIFIHGYNLGLHTHYGWFGPVWIFYGVTLVLSLGYIYWYKLSNKHKELY